MKEYKKIQKGYIYTRDGGRCCFCNRLLNPSKTTLDHYLPKSSGGTDDYFNLVLCCKKCNKLKGGSIPADYPDKMIELFRLSVRDNKINYYGLGISYNKLEKIAEELERLEAIDDFVVLQGKHYRLYISDNKIKKLVRLNGQD